MTAKKTSEQEPPKSNPPSAKAAANPFGRNLDIFLARIDGIAGHIGMPMAAIVQSHKQTHAQVEAYVKAHGSPVQGEPGAFTFPTDRVSEFRRLSKKFQRSQHALTSFPRGLTVAMVSEFDAYMGETLKAFYRSKPDALNATNRSLTFQELNGFASIDEARDYVLEKEVESFLRSSHSEQFSALAKKLDTPLTKDLAIWPEFIELTERRNLFVHNDGAVNSQYLQVCSGHGVDCSSTAKGKTLGANPKYFARAHEVLYELAVKLAHVLWRKLTPDDRESADAHLAGTVVYDLLYDERYRLARVISDFGATFKTWGSDYYRRALVINRAQAYLWDGQRDEGLKLLNAEDWSAASDEFQVCVAALRLDIRQTIGRMKALGRNAGPKKAGYREWPVFKELRKSTEFQLAFEEVFGEPFGTVTVSTVGDDAVATIDRNTSDESPADPPAS